MPFFCDLCGKEIPRECANWGTFEFGVICEDHNHDDVAKVVELTATKVRDKLVQELANKFYNQVFQMLEEI